MQITGHVTIETSTGERAESDNMVVTTGLARMAALLAQDSTAWPTHIAIGTGSTAVAAGNTALVAEVDRNAIGSQTSSGAVWTLKAFFTKAEANGSTIAEAGLFDAAAAGTLIARTVLASTVAKDATKSLTVTWTFTLS